MIYFASDFHLGLGGHEKSLAREKKIIKWLDKIKDNAEEIYLLGDIFEFWYEWKYVVPKYFTRFFGKLAELTDSGIKINYFTGNHDIWAYGYLQKELGINIFRKPQTLIHGNKKFFLAHGDGLGPGDKSYKIMKRFFENKFLQWTFSNLLHPDLAFRLAMKISHQRDACNKKAVFKGNDEWLIKFAENELQKNHEIDFFVFGHRHLAEAVDLPNNAKLIMLGDWIKLFTYAQFDGQNLFLKHFEG